MADPFRIEIDSTGAGDDLAKAYAELAKEAAPTPPPVAAAPQPAKPAEPMAPPPPLEPGSMARYEELCRAPSMKMEKADLGVITEFSQVIAAVNDAARCVERIEKSHPAQVPDRIIRLMKDNLRDSAQTMLKELHAMRNGRVQKKYDKRYVCCECHAVFLVPLPGDNICDACRAASIPRSAPY